MDFDLAFQFILESFQKEKINFALIGGFALQAVGMTRATRDIDMLILVDDKDKVKNIMLEQGYQLGYESKNVMNFFGVEIAKGRIDFLIAHRHYALEMLKKAVEKDILDGKYKVKVITVEDQIGLKVQSSTNDKERCQQDLSDIEWLIRSNYSNLNMELVKEYFKIFKKENELDKILNKVKNAK